MDLEKVRYGERLEVALCIYEKMEGIMVAPLLILPFVENSFKHGASNQLTHGWIHIDVGVQDKRLVIEVENSKPDFNHDNKNASGIGLENLKKRLNHLYPDRYSLQLFDEQDTYLAVLKLALNNDTILRP